MHTTNSQTTRSSIRRVKKTKIITKQFEITLCSLDVRGLIIGLLVAMRSFNLSITLIKLNDTPFFSNSSDIMPSEEV